MNIDDFSILKTALLYSLSAAECQQKNETECLEHKNYPL
jgi:hypothetical protein